MIKVEVDENIRCHVEKMAADINKYINSGKWELFNDDAKELASLYPVNDLLLMGVKYIRLPNKRFYLELPYRELEDADVEKILVQFSKATSIKE